MWKSLSVALVLALGSLVAGCGAEAVDPRTAVAEAAPATTGAGSSRVDFAVSMTIGGEELAFAGEGEFDYGAQRGRLTYDMSSFFASFGEAPPDAFGDGKMEVVFDGLVFYVGFPQGSAIEEELGEGKRWMRIDLEQIGEEAGVDLGALMRLNQSPIDQLRLLYAASDSVEELGTEEVRGVETTRYRAQVDFGRALDATLDESGLEGEEREALERQLRSLKDESGLDAPIPIDLWLDGDGLLRRLVLDLAAPEGQELAMTMTMTMELYDFGVEVDVEAPAPGTYVDLTDTFPETT